MKKKIKHTVNLILIVVLLLATGGMSVYRSYCPCSGNTFVGIFKAPETCGGSESSACHCGDKCCSQEDGIAKKCSSCGHTEVFFAKMNSDFFASASVNIPLLQLKFIELSAVEQPIAMLHEKEDFRIVVDESPPPSKSSGKKIITLLHRFKFDQHDSFLFV